MKAEPFGRFLFGLSSVFFGVIALVWHDADTWQSMRNLWSLPLGVAFGDFLMVALVFGGLGILLMRTTRVASIVLTAVYIVFSLACIPGIVAKPGVYAAYGSFFEQFSLVCGALAIVAATQTRAEKSAALWRVARLGLGVCAVSFTLAQLAYLHFTASLVPAWIAPNQLFWAILTTIAFALAALAMLIEVSARLAMRLMGAMTGLFGLLVWVPLVAAHPGTHGNWSELALTFLISGAALTVGGTGAPLTE